MEKNDAVFVRHITDAINTIHEHTKNVSKEVFLTNKLIQDAVISEIEIIGEAANRLSHPFCAQHADVPWHKIIGMRNLLIHGYFEVDLREVCRTVEKDISELRTALEK